MAPAPRTSGKMRRFTGMTFAAMLMVLPLAVIATEPPRSASVPPTQPPARLHGDDGAPMALIPAGAFTMGALDGHEDERPPHAIRLKAYYLDVYEVTVDRYARFLKGVNAEHPLAWRDATNGSHGNKPVVGVDWFDAQEYCQWVGKRLPTEAEWEKAARGSDERRYPWGSETPTRAHANFSRPAWKGYSTLTEVGHFEQGRSPYGLYDMAGNVWEWVADRYERTYYAHSPAENPAGPSAGPLRVLRGGAWSNETDILRASNRGGYPPGAHRSDFGFRCARDVPS